MGGFSEGGIPNCARADLTSSIKPITQRTSLTASASIDRASTRGQSLTISGASRSPVSAHSSSVTKGMIGWSIRRMVSKVQPATAWVSASTSPLISSRYQSQKRSQAK